MASLTPGLLSKLLESAGNKEVRVTGEHRAALLQVIEIVPSLCGAPNDPWQSRGFFLKVSDSLHSAYVSISDEDLDLIYSDKIQLGQFVSVSRFDVSASGSPVPVIRGLKPIPSKRRPFVGNPKDLVSSDSLPNSNITVKTGFSKEKEKKLLSGPRPSEINNIVKKSGLLDYSKSRKRDSFGNGHNKVQGGLDQTRRLSLDSARRIWDHQTPTPKTVPLKKSSSNNVHSDKKVHSKIYSSQKRLSLSLSPLKTKNETPSPIAIFKPLEKDVKSATDHAIPSRLVQVPLTSKTWSKCRVYWDAIPPAIHNLGKETLCCKNAAVSAATRALEEASAADNVILCLQAFAELHESAESASSGLLVEQFLDLYKNMQRSARMINSLLSDASLLETKSSNYDNLQSVLPDVCKSSTNTNATSWVHAAIQTNLSKFSLFKKPEKSGVLNSDKCYYIILDDTLKELDSENHSLQNKPSPRNHRNFKQDSSAKRVPSPVKKQQLASMMKMNPEKRDYPRGNGLKETASLVDKLLLDSREWFLRYMEDSLKEGFGLCGGKSSDIAGLLGQLKRVNQWLDGLVGSGVKGDARIEGLKKKLYGFLLEHVDSAIVTSG